MSSEHSNTGPYAGPAPRACLDEVARFDALLAQSAPLAMRVAPRLCVETATGRGCEGYHGSWQYFRVFGVGQHMWETDTGFLVTALSALARDGSFSRVLVSGAADYGILARLLAAYRYNGIEPQVTVVDICRTPLYFADWFAERAGVVFETHRADILAYRPDEPFDLILTHCFMNWFSPAERAGLADAWRRQLRPGGALVTVQKLMPGAGAGLLPEKTKDQVEARIRRTIAAAQASDAPDRPPPTVIEAMVRSREQASRQLFAVRTAQELRGLFAERGFLVRHLREIDNRPVRWDEQRDPSSRRVRRVGLVAVRT